jgi:hypothetical protein
MKSALRKLAIVVAGIDIAIVAITVVSKITEPTWPFVVSLVLFSANAALLLRATSDK